MHRFALTYSRLHVDVQVVGNTRGSAWQNPAVRRRYSVKRRIHLTGPHALSPQHSVDEENTYGALEANEVWQIVAAIRAVAPSTQFFPEVY